MPLQASLRQSAHCSILPSCCSCIFFSIVLQGSKLSVLGVWHILTVTSLFATVSKSIRYLTLIVLKTYLTLCVSANTHMQILAIKDRFGTSHVRGSDLKITYFVDLENRRDRCEVSVLLNAPLPLHHLITGALYRLQ